MIAIGRALYKLIERQNSIVIRLPAVGMSDSKNGNNKINIVTSRLLSKQTCSRLGRLSDSNSCMYSGMLRQVIQRNYYACGDKNAIIRFHNKLYSSRRQFSSKTEKTSDPDKPTSSPSSANKMAQLISGKEVSEEIRQQLKVRVSSLKIQPKLAIVQVGGRADSNVYIRMKIQFAESIGALAEHIQLPKEATQDEVSAKVIELNKDKTVHGIITQLPFDTINEINSDYIVNLIDPMKDVDGLSIYNAGKLLHGELDGSSFVPCTPNGCIKLIEKSGINLEGTRSVVIGRSKIVGSPMAQLLVWKNSTVTICHSRTKNLDEICRQADIVVAAVGRAQMVKASWLKPGAVVIDCGINMIPDASKKSGSRLVGDVDFEECKEVASAITPVPGGVGPMTVAMLIANTVKSAERN